MIRRGSDVLQYDADNRLTSVQRNSGDPVPFDYSLQKDWNVVSFPYLPADKSVLNVLSGLTFGTDYDQVSYYDAANNEWKHFVNDPLFNDFESFEYGKAYHISIKNASGVNFTVTGNLSEFSETFDLKVGNNYFSTIRATNNVISDVLAGVTYTDVLEFDATTQSWVSVPVSNELELGKGYAIQVSADDSFVINTEVLNITYAYGPNGDRIKMTSPSGTTTYVGSAFEKRGTNETKYVFLDDFRIAEFRTNGGLFFLHTDHLNSTNVVTDSAGLQVQRYEYKPYGQTAYTDNPQGASFTHKFTGQKEDADASLYYYNARYYDPELGRFIQADSFVQAPYDPQTLNRYAYVRNNPIKFTDPSGNIFGIITAIVAIVKAVAAIAGAVIQGIAAAFNALAGVYAAVAAEVVGVGAIATGLGKLMAGAQIGAILGGLDAAVNGNDIGRGIGYGAIGGALAGTLTGALQSVAISPIVEKIPAAVARIVQIGSLSSGAVAAYKNKAYFTGSYLAILGLDAAIKTASQIQSTIVDDPDLNNDQLNSEGDQKLQEASRRAQNNLSTQGSSSSDAVFEQSEARRRQRGRFVQDQALKNGKRSRIFKIRDPFDPFDGGGGSGSFALKFIRAIKFPLGGIGIRALLLILRLI